MNRAVLVSPRSDHGCNDPKDYKTNDNRQAVRICGAGGSTCASNPCCHSCGQANEKELRLITFPITLGTGKRLFEEGTIAAAFTLIESLVTSNGVVFTSYKRAGEVKTGTVG